jgi:hypothetical protein
VAGIEVEVAHLRSDSLTLSYAVTGKMSDVATPAVRAPTRADELWRHTCFEAFLQASNGPEYYEFNFAPSTQWAAYRFTSYRAGMTPAAEFTAAKIDVRSGSDSFTLRTTLELGHLSSLARVTPWRLGLSAVIEETSGHKSYWALAHPPGQPDFHHTTCFVHEFSPSVEK